MHPTPAESRSVDHVFEAPVNAFKQSPKKHTSSRNQPATNRQAVKWQVTVVGPKIPGVQWVQTYGMAPHLERSQAKACPRPENLECQGQGLTKNPPNTVGGKHSNGSRGYQRLKKTATSSEGSIHLSKAANMPQCTSEAYTTYNDMYHEDEEIFHSAWWNIPLSEVLSSLILRLPNEGIEPAELATSQTSATARKFPWMTVIELQLMIEVTKGLSRIFMGINL